ncbi:LOW QUALITY PROTEIN: interferon-stimulated 20 kDa exonuclease-like 2 [Tachyglossus aculeatus]|uniref:LOW QUALITY PROTEIN: interferon-stimulated 20 kDa exonuclease-like 2 n=1 Tax=Tachyglossus aculeatus TaxID=9261 RepID=UPI0018F63CD9|nr:LOW QUALITY PROTEIN: interferon-stimulated 20 kDa exonuclease-like 2 [Tachyglossus aculeatus]
MSTLLLNMSLDAPPGPAAPPQCPSASRHQRFLKRRRLLERRRLLKDKQLPPRSAAPGKDKPPAPPRESQEQPCAPPAPPAQTGAVAWVTPASRGKGAAARPLPSAEELLNEFAAANEASPAGDPTKVVAVDCEMVGTGPRGHCSSLARCSIVSYHGDVLYDRYVRPPCPIVNYRTRWSGIRKRHMAIAVPFQAARKEILKLLAGKVVIGHAVHNDFKALHYSHPRSLTRDTSRIPLLNRRAGFPECEAISLKRLTKKLLHQDIQTGSQGHSSVEDARATMELYKVVEDEWEEVLRRTPQTN